MLTDPDRLIPTVLMPLSVLSYASILGILSTLFLVLVMFIDGFAKKHGPGSLWDPAETSLTFGSIGQLGLSFGLFMAGVSGTCVGGLAEIHTCIRAAFRARCHTLPCARHD